MFPIFIYFENLQNWVKMFIHPFWNDQESIPTFAHNIVAGCIFLIGAFGIISNIIVIVFYLKWDNIVKKFHIIFKYNFLLRLKSLRKPSNYFIINLALADLLLLLSNVPMCFVSSLKNKWIFGQIGIFNTAKHQYFIILSKEKSFLF